MIEWKDPYNPFNSMKVLMWPQHLDGIVNQNFLPPVQVDTDPSYKCNYDCIWCLPKGTLILTGEWEYKRIEDLSLKEVIIGFGSRKLKNKCTSLVRTKIENIVSHEAVVLVEIKTERGVIRITPDHKIWESRGRWKLAKNFKKNDYITSFGYSNYQERNDIHKKGWLCGMADGDGCFWTVKDKRRGNSKSRRQFRLALNDKDLLITFKQWAKKFNYKLYDGTCKANRFGKYEMEAIYLTKSKDVFKFEKWLHYNHDNIDYFYGWLGGIFDAEGSFSNNILRISQNKKNIKNRIKRYLTLCGFKFMEEKNGVRLIGGQRAFIRFFNLCKPILDRKKNKLLDASVRSKTKVIEVRKIPCDDIVYDITTGTRNFIANGVKVHNCNAFLDLKKSDCIMPEDHLLKLADFYAEWGVKSTCIAGGGEPLMNRGVKNFLLRLKKNGIEAGIITNGLFLNEELSEVIAETCRWIGISVDAGTNKTYRKIKNIHDDSFFIKVINNIEKLTTIIKNKETKCDVAYKYLLHPTNAKEIFIAAQLAKSIGVKDFHLRPVGWDNIMKTLKKDPIDFTSVLEEIDRQIEESMKLEDENFRFFGIKHKFRPNFERKVNFKRCWASPLVLTFGADGKCHLCFDIRGKEELILCSHYPDPKEVLKHWNSDRHKKILKSINVNKCPRCTFGPYNEIVEKVFIKDSMCRNFP